MTSQYGIESSRFDAKKRERNEARRPSERSGGEQGGVVCLFIYFHFFTFFLSVALLSRVRERNASEWRKRVEGEGEWKWAERGRVELSIASIHPSNDRAHAL